MISTHDLTEEQLRGIDSFAAWYRNGKKHGFGPRPTWKLAGPAGSGKSTVASFAVEAAGISSTGSDVAKVALAGKAALVMRQKGLADARTIHSAIYTPEDEVGGLINAEKARLLTMRGALGSLRGGERDAALAEIGRAEAAIRELQDRDRDEVRWILNPFGTVANSKLVVADEGSMIGGPVQRDLESFDVPIFYLGDLFQLPPIDDNDDSVFFDHQGRAMPVDFELTEIHRQAEGSPIIRYSRDLRLNLPGMNFFGKQVGDDGGVLLRVRAGRLGMNHIARAEITLCGFNETRHRINAGVREFLGRRSPYPEAGDRVICLRNNKEQKLVNGEMGTVISGARDFDRRAGTCRMTVALDEGRELVVDALVAYFEAPGDPEALRAVPRWSHRGSTHFDYANAISTHKGQGSQWRSGVNLEERWGRSPILRRRHWYTGATRFERDLIIEAA